MKFNQQINKNLPVVYESKQEISILGDFLIIAGFIVIAAQAIFFSPAITTSIPSMGIVVLAAVLLRILFSNSKVINAERKSCVK